jgi:DNA-binding MarR family transcriptional regulator
VPDPAIADLAARLRVEMGRLVRQSRRHARGRYTPSQASALASLDRHGPMRLGELARAESLAPPTLTKIVAGLESCGLVERSVDPADRRGAVVGLTKAGRAALAKMRSERTAHLAERISLLSPAERALLADAIDLITRLAEPEAEADE